MDVDGLDRSLWDAVTQWGRACAKLRASPNAAAPNPLARARVLDPVVDGSALQGADEWLAEPLRAWAITLAVERACWNDRAAEAAWWAAARPLATGGPPLEHSLASLRGRVLGPDATSRGRHAEALASAAAPLSEAALDALERRFQVECQLRGLTSPEAWLPGSTPGQAARLAQAVLDQTAELAVQGRDGWWEGVHASMGAEAGEGWPAQLRADWLADVFAQGELGDPVSLPAMPTPRGALSFARALGLFGIAILDRAGRGFRPRVLHCHPFGTRRPERFAAFGLLVGEPSFAQRVLGLGRDRSRVHRRHVAAAMLVAWRFQALQVAVGEALRASRSAARERFVALAPSVFGASVPDPLLGVLPRLDWTDAARLVGTVLAGGWTSRMVERFDEDWFRNPQAIRFVRESDHQPELVAALDETALDDALQAHRRAFAEALR